MKYRIKVILGLNANFLMQWIFFMLTVDKLILMDYRNFKKKIALCNAILFKEIQELSGNISLTENQTYCNRLKVEQNIQK